MKGLSLFSGIGGLDLPFEAVGGRVIAMCERDTFCREVLRRHWPNVPLYDDVKTLRGEEIEAAFGRVDVIYGGFPCQPFSYSGNQKGKNDDRYLWPECARLVGEVKPDWCVFENVPGILTLAADDVCEDLERQGYAVGIFMHEAAALGAPHRRMRVFFVAHTQGGRPPSRLDERGRHEKEDREGPEHTASGSGEPPGFVQDSGRGMRKGRAISGTLCGKYGEVPPVDPERSGGPSHAGTDVSDAESGGRREGTAYEGRSGEGGKSRTWNRSAAVRAVISDADVQRREKQQSSIAENGKRATLSSIERNRQGRAEPGLGGVAHGLSGGLDGNSDWLSKSWWRQEPDIPRAVSRGVPHRVQRLKALGNAVVPAQIYPIFAAIAQIHRDDRRDET
jgi:DNA (cytosine-5)-methyltransferase 1